VLDVETGHDARGDDLGVAEDERFGEKWLASGEHPGQLEILSGCALSRSEPAGETSTVRRARP
jgi:hypothetical protein